MKHYFVAIILFFIVIQTNAVQNSLDYLWNTNSVQYAFINRTNISLSEKVHYSMNAQAIDLYYFDFTVTHPVINHISSGIGVRRLLSRQINTWKVENRFMLYLNYNSNSQFIDLNFSNRISYQQYPQAKDNLRYYHKLILAYPWKIFSGKVHPYLGEEIYVKLNQDNFHLWRAYAGLKLVASKPVSIDLFYAEEFHKNSIKTWSYFGLIGANLNIKLNQ